MHIALLAGEPSGDQLGAELIQALCRINPCIRFDGIGGPLMQAQGFKSLMPMEEFSVMGITEVLKNLPRLLRYRKKLVDYYKTVLPDAFIGIDYPEFNLSIQKQLKTYGIYTAQYVSPSVWAWREHRIRHIKAASNLVLTLFEFEKKFYDQHEMPAVYCGHPLLDMIDKNPDTLAARKTLGLIKEKRLSAIDLYSRYLAVLPGSREQEVTRMLPIFIEVMQFLSARLPEVHFLIPAVNAHLAQLIKKILRSHAPHLPVHIYQNQSGKTVMTAADAVLLASGTAALEAMLLQKPMVVSYQVSRLTAFLAKKKIRTKYFSLPNLLANHRMVAEFIQDDINTKVMSDVLYDLITPGKTRELMIKRLIDLRKKLKPNAADNAARALYQDILYREIDAI